MPNYRRVKVLGGIYFFTLVAAGRQPVFTQEATHPALRAALQTVRYEHPFQIKAWVLLPGHLHCLLRLPEKDIDYPLRWQR